MKKAGRPVTGVSKATPSTTKTQTADRAKPEGASVNTTMGTAGKTTTKTSTSAPLSKVNTNANTINKQMDK